jgi:hypothetical protein
MTTATCCDALRRFATRGGEPAGCWILLHAIVDNLLKQFAQSSQLGSNAAYIEDLYEQYLVAPDSVDAEVEAYFDGFKGREAGDVPHSAVIAQIAEAGRQAANVAWSVPRQAA